MNRSATGLALPTADLAAISSASSRALGRQIATRAASMDAWAFSAWLPNPDPVLKAQGRDIAVYREMRSDAHIGGCIRRRRAGVRTLETRLDTTGVPVRVARAIEAMLADLEATPTPDEPGAEPGMQALIVQAMDGALYGYQPIELTWGRRGSLLLPTAAQAKPPEWFVFDPEGKLRFKSREAGMTGEPLPPRKFLLVRQDATYLNPYGMPDLSMCFWPYSFRKGGAKFWTRWLEKHGGTFLVGKLPRSASAGEYNDLLNKLERMVQDAIAAIPDDGSVAPLESGDKGGSTDAHERYLRYWRSEITIALLGTNQGMETDSTRASATAALEVGDDVRDSDAAMIAAAVNQMIRWAVDVNWPGAKAPLWALVEQEEIDQDTPARDKLLTECGVRFTRDYWLRTYDLEDGDLAEDTDDDIGDAMTNGGETPAQDETDEEDEEERLEQPSSDAGQDDTADMASLDSAPSPGEDDVRAWVDRLEADAAPAVEHVLQDIRAMLARAGSLEEFRAMLEDGYTAIDHAPLIAALQQANAAAMLAGIADVQDNATGDRQ